MKGKAGDCMGYDISNHPVDVQFLQPRLTPAVMGRGDSSDFVDRQLAVAAATPAAASTGGGGFRNRLRRMTAAPAPVRMRPATGLPDFDADLSVWGRPFFVTAREPDEGCGFIEASEVYSGFMGAMN